MSHSRAKLNPFGRRLLCECIATGFPVRVAAQMVGISRARAYVIWHAISMRVRRPSCSARAGRATSGGSPQRA